MRILSVTLTLFTFLLAGCTSIPGFNHTVINGSGDSATETRTVANFESVSLAGDGELRLTQDGTETLVVEADDNVLPLIETFVRNGTLIIKTRNNTTLRTVTPIRYTLSVKELNGLKLSGDGNVITSDIETDKLQLKLSGDGEMTLGVVEAPEGFTIDMSGDGSFIIDAVNSSKTSVDISGDGNVTMPMLTAEELKTTISGNGTVTIAGEATKLIIDISGDGEIIADNLQSSDAEIDISGDANVSLWVEETMVVKLSGDADISYLGNPQISEDISGDGKLTRLEN